MIQSENHPEYFKLPDLFGFCKVRHGWEWGRRHMIEFLTRLENAWSQDMYWQIDEYNNFAKIPIGDIGAEGDSPSREKVERIRGHRSHRTGVDVDIYVLRKDGTPSEHVTPALKDHYDFARTSELGNAILRAGGKDLTYVFIGDKQIHASMSALARSMSLTAQVLLDSPMHDNHFHIRLVTRNEKA